MKTIIRADDMGFCMGVERAVSLVQDLADDNTAGPKATLGPIIHNSQVVQKFKDEGVHPIENADDIECGTVVIRAHGISPSEKNILKDKDINILDGTCPKVIASQKIVQKYSDLGYQIIILGDRDHGEIHGLAGCAADYIIIENEGDAENLDVSVKSLLICQTTIKLSEFLSVSEVLKQKNNNIKIHNSICSATNKRQEAVRELSLKVEAIIVVGGKDSANTKRLYDTAVEVGAPSWHIAGIEDIPEEISSYQTIGITAGASTPEWVIIDVEKKLMTL